MSHVNVIGDSCHFNIRSFMNDVLSVKHRKTCGIILQSKDNGVYIKCTTSQHVFFFLGHAILWNLLDVYRAGMNGRWFTTIYFFDIQVIITVTIVLIDITAVEANFILVGMIIIIIIIVVTLLLLMFIMMMMMKMILT